MPAPPVNDVSNVRFALPFDSGNATLIAWDNTGVGGSSVLVQIFEDEALTYENTGVAGDELFDAGDLSETLVVGHTYQPRVTKDGFSVVAGPSLVYG